MRLPSQFTIGRLMAVVAIVAGLLGLFGPAAGISIIMGAALIFAPALLTLLAPVLFARPGRRLLVGIWVAVLWPLFTSWSIYVAWLILSLYLGHPPEPRDNGPVIELLSMTILIFLLSAPVATYIGWFLPFGMDGYNWTTVAWHLQMVSLSILVWVLDIVILNWDPMQAGEWFMD